ncbi:hypothetical protein [Campylobacter rectus]|nr:hypothetical protein [Campylobacter rectus]
MPEFAKALYGAFSATTPPMTRGAPKHSQASRIAAKTLTKNARAVPARTA